MSTVEDHRAKVQPLTPREDGFTEPGSNRTYPRYWRSTFLAHVAATGNVTQAIKLCGVSKSSVYKRIRAEPKFAERFRQAKKESVANLEAEAYRRVFEGVLETQTVTRKDADGTVRAIEEKTVRRYSDGLLVRYLERYSSKWARKTKVDQTIHDDRAISRDQLQAALKDPESRELLARLAERQALLASPGAQKDCTVQSITVVSDPPSHAQLAETTTCGKNPVLNEPFGGDEAGVQAEDGNGVEQPGDGG